MLSEQYPMMQVLVPMTGKGSRFADEGIRTWKPLIQVRGKAIIDWTLSCLPEKAHTVLLVPPERVEELEEHEFERNVTLVASERKGKGPADTILDAHLLNPDWPVVIANCDQFVEWDIAQPSMEERLWEGPRGILATFRYPDPKWSFVRGEADLVEEVRAKDPFGVTAVVGIYGFRYWKDVVDIAKRALKAGEAAPNGELYICPLYNRLKAQYGWVEQIRVRRMWGLGDPADVRRFEREYKG